MYENIGGKIKGLAKVLFILEAIVAFITGIYLIAEANNDSDTFFCVLLMFGGPIMAWISSWCLYGFGELVDKACSIESKLCPEETKPQNPTLYQEYNSTPFQAPAPVQTSNNSDVNKSNAPVSAEMRNGEKVCPKCGTAQRADRTVCWSCGQHFDN